MYESCSIKFGFAYKILNRQFGGSEEHRNKRYCRKDGNIHIKYAKKTNYQSELSKYEESNDALKHFRKYQNYKSNVFLICFINGNTTQIHPHNWQLKVG